MRYICLPHPPHLPRRWVILHEKRVAALNEQATHALRRDFLNRYGSWTKLKRWLTAFSGGKCWYCEAKSIRAPFDVDHFRPKLAITVDGVKLKEESGYYWLAYEWSNFRLSCQRCNRPETDIEVASGKANEFPLRNEQHRSLTQGDILDNEEPRLLDPCIEADCGLLAHGLDGEVKPFPGLVEWDHIRASYTIKQLGLNDFGTPEVRRKQWQSLDLLIRLAGEKPEVIDQIAAHVSPHHEYSSFFRSVLGSHRDKDWVEQALIN